MNHLNSLIRAIVIKLTPKRIVEATKSRLHVGVSEVLIAGVADLNSFLRRHQDGPGREGETQSTGPAYGDRLAEEGG